MIRPRISATSVFCKRSGVAEQALGVGVLRFEMVADIGDQERGIAQHLLPVGILQPGIVVRQVMPWAVKDADGAAPPAPADMNFWCHRSSLGHSALAFESCLHDGVASCSRRLLYLTPKQYRVVHERMARASVTRPRGLLAGGLYG